MKKVFSLVGGFLLFSTVIFSRNILADSTRHDSLLVRDGSSYSKAIIIMDSTEGAGVRAEYQWLALHYPDYSSNGQSLNMNTGKPYDILHIENAAGNKKEIYFDIGHYFGKW